MSKDPAWALAEHVCDRAYTDLPISTLDATRNDILDTFGCLLGGSELIIPCCLDFVGGARELLGTHDGGLPRRAELSGVPREPGDG